MIKIRNSEMTELASIAVASSALRVEKINSDNILNFSIRIKDSASAYINGTNIIDLDGDYFDIVFYKKEQRGDGRLMASVECEHVSYRLNEFKVNSFLETGTVTEILTAILSGTGFTVGTVDFAQSETFQFQQEASRRALLMKFAAYVGGELQFNGFQISLLNQRGSSTPKALTPGKDITVISKSVNKRVLDEVGNPQIAYTCGVYKGTAVDLGDVVTMNYNSLDIDVSLRVVSKSYDPFNPNNVTIEVGNYIPAIEDDFYRIETETVKKDSLYYGVRIGPTHGFESVRSDNLARAYFNADNLTFQRGDGTGENWTDALYMGADGLHMEDGNIITQKWATKSFYDVNGQLISTKEIPISRILITPGDGFKIQQNDYSYNEITDEVTDNWVSVYYVDEDGNIINTAVKRSLYSSDANVADIPATKVHTAKKVQKYLDGDDYDFIHMEIYDNYIDVIHSHSASGEVQARDDNNNRLYWTDSTHKYATTKKTNYPVYEYNYTDDWVGYIYAENEGIKIYQENSATSTMPMLRNIMVTTTAPTEHDGEDGDICFVVSP